MVPLIKVKKKKKEEKKDNEIEEKIRNESNTFVKIVSNYL